MPTISTKARKKSEAFAPIASVLNVPGACESQQRLVFWQICFLFACILIVLWALLPGNAPLRGLFRILLVAAWISQYALSVGYGIWLLRQSIAVMRAGQKFIPAAPLLDDKDLPTYTILLPLYDEAAVAPQLINAIRSLDYPPDRMQTLLVLREEDAETRHALALCGIEAEQETHGDETTVGIKILFLPKWLPIGTKPAACNWGLAHATGELLVIYDAEDLPDRDQLRKAAAALKHASSDVACVQTPKLPYNGSTNLLTGMYETEMVIWQTTQLPGLTAREKLSPLFGSGAHFRTAILSEIGGWDYYNVTEDCDMGIRLQQHGYHIALMDSVTGEEAPTELGTWLRQRTRWNKGFLHTFLRHTRNPFDLFRILGWRRAIGFAVRTANAVLNQMVGLTTRLLPVVWLFVMVIRNDSLDLKQNSSLEVYLISAGMTLFAFALGLQAAGLALARRWNLLPYVLLFPIYWLLLGIASWRAIWELAVAPFKWEKTSHGAKT